jgi:ABC-type Fe3+ transport system substrate-binding protein
MPAKWILAATTAALACLPVHALAADAALIEAAKKEGQVTWYTTFIVNQVTRPMIEAFEKKYGIKVNYIRNDAQDIVLRVENEVKAGRLEADLFDGTGSAPYFKRKGMLAQYLPDSTKNYPKEYLDPDRYWAGVSLYLQTFGYNTTMVKKGTEPKSLDDLLDPKWKGQMGLSASSSSPGVGGFVGYVLAKKGEAGGIDYLKRLRQQNVAIVPGSARQVLDQVIAGEYPIGLQILNHHVAFSSNRGAPVAWTPIEDAMAVLLTVSIFKDAPHPNAARLLMDFVFADDGQNVLREADYIPASPSVEPKDPSLRPDGKIFRARVFTPEELDANTEKWMKIYDQTLR